MMNKAQIWLRHFVLGVYVWSSLFPFVSVCFAMERPHQEAFYLFNHRDRWTDECITKIFIHSEDDKTLGRASQVCWRWYDSIAALDRQALAFDHEQDWQALAFEREREELIGRILEATNAELSPIAIARRNPKFEDIRDLLTEPEILLIKHEKDNFWATPYKTAIHPFFGGIIDKEKRIAQAREEQVTKARGTRRLTWEERLLARNLWDILSHYQNYRDVCVTLQGNNLLQYITPKAILYIDDQHIYRLSSSLAYTINSINAYNISQRENDAGNHAVCQLGKPGHSVHFKNNNSHTDLSPAMESAMYGFYRLIAPNSVIPSFFMRIEELDIKRPQREDVMSEWNEVISIGDSKDSELGAKGREIQLSNPAFTRQEIAQKVLEDFINEHADKQNDLFKPQPQNFILQGSRTAEGSRFDEFLMQVKQKQASYDAINRESFSYHILLSLLFNPSDYKADNLFLSPEGNIVGIDNDGCLAHPIVYGSFEKHIDNWYERKLQQRAIGNNQPLRVTEGQKDHYFVGVKNVLYLLPLMQKPIHEKVIKTFQNLNIPLTLLRWMSFLDAQDKRYKMTFDSQGLERHVEKNHSFPVRLVPGTMVALYESLRNLQDILADFWGMTHHQLLMKIQPLVGEAYQAHLTRDPDPLTAMSIIYDRTEDLAELLSNRIDDLQREAHSKDAYTRNRKASLSDEIKSVLSKLQEDDKHLAQVLDYLVCYLPDYAPYLPVAQDSMSFKRMLAGGASLSSLRWLLAHKPQNALSDINWQPDDLLNYAKSFMPQSSLRHLKGHLNPIVSFILNHFGEWVDELLPILPENAWHQIIQEQSEGGMYNKAVFDFLMRRNPLGVNQLVNGRSPLDDAFECLFKYPNRSCAAEVAIDLINRGSWEMSLSGRKYRDLKKKADLSPFFWQAFQTLQERNAKVGWTVTLEEIFPLDVSSKQQTGQNIILGTSGEKRLLTETILKQLESPHREISEGRRKVIQITANGCFAYVKFYPELVGIEEAVGELTRRMIGFGAPYGELFKFPDGKPAWVSQGISGRTLQWILINDPDRLKKLDPVSTTQFILMAMLTNPEDGKPDNYIVEPLPGNPNLYRLSSPDNDHGFVPAFVKTKPDKGNIFTKPELVVQVKTTLYCLDLMNKPIPQQTRQLFSKGDPLAQMEEWLNALDIRNTRYTALYSNDEVFDLLNSHECFIGVPFQEEMIDHLYSKWVRLQDCLLGPKSDKLTLLGVLGKLEPRLADRYQTAFKEPQNKTVWDRFKWVDGNFYEWEGDHWAGLTPSGSILISQNIPMQESTLEAIRKGFLGPKVALKKLKEIAEQKGKSGSSIEYMVSDSQREAFLKKYFGERQPSEQRNILNHLAPHVAGLRNLTLKNCAVLDNSRLRRDFLGGDLVSLDLTGCKEITHSILPFLSQNMPVLAVLNLSNLPAFQWFADANALSFGYNPITFGRLRKLSLNNCTGLEAINIDAPNLKNLWTQGAKKLTLLKIKAAIKDEVFYNLLETTPNLKLSQIDVSNCPNMTIEAKFLLTETHKRRNYVVRGVSKQPMEFGDLTVSVTRASKEIRTSKNLSGKSSKDRGSIDDTAVTMLVKELAIIGQTSITMLWLRWNQIGDAGVVALAQNTSLTKLYLSNNQVGSAGAIALAQNTILTLLDLDGNKVDDVGAIALSQNTTLTSLNLEDNSINEAGVQALAHNTSLTFLNLNSNYIGDIGATALAQNTTLISLHLLDTQVGVAGAQALACNTTLNSINLNNNHIGDIGAIALAQNTTLKLLHLNANKISDIGAKNLFQNTTLRMLYLDGNQIGNEGMIALKQNTTLITLYLQDNQIGDEGIKTFMMGMRGTLKTLYLQGNPFGKEVRERIGTGIFQNDL